MTQRTPQQEKLAQALAVAVALVLTAGLVLYLLSLRGDVVL